MRIVRLIVLIIFLAGSAQGQIPFSKGVNLTQWFQTSGPRQIQFTKFTRQDFQNIQSLGCDVIRLPINLHFMTSGAPDYIVDPLFYSFLDETINWAEELHLHLILDNHTFDPAADTDPAIGAVLIKVWTQLARRYSDRSDYLYYEILNEPHGISDAEWGQIQGDVIDAIREVDTKHTVIVGGAGWNSFNNLEFIPAYDDPNLIYTFHFYEPFVFTHQGATWTDPSMGALAGVPFPYQASPGSILPSELVGTWIEDRMNRYWFEGTPAYIRSMIDIALRFRDNRQVPIFCGEFGAYIPNAAPQDRVFYYEEVRKYLEQNDIPWTSWDYQGGFGLFEAGSSGLFEHDLNLPLLVALGLSTPEQKDLVIEPETQGFYLFNDFFGTRIIESSSAGEGIVDFYNQEDAYDGDFCIKWANANQYSNLGFQFRPIKDLSKLHEEEYYLDFWVRGNTPGTQFVMRFIDTKDDQMDHPWRMGFEIDDTGIRLNGAWRRMRIPLDEMVEMGSWDNGIFFDPTGEFDWSKVDEFEIVAEQKDLEGAELWFDNIRITNEIVTGRDDPDELSADLKVYPNPVSSGQITLEYLIETPGRVHLAVLDLTGRRVLTLLNRSMDPGKYIQPWDGQDSGHRRLPNGVYLCKLKTPKKTIIQKLFLKY